MPTSIIAAAAGYWAASAAAEYATVELAMGAAGSALIGGATGMLVSSAVNAAFASTPDAPQQMTQELRDNLVTVRQPISDWQYIYGRTRCTGALTFAHESADQNFHLVITYAGHVCQEIEAIHFDDEVVPLDGSGNATGKYAGFVRIKKSLGDEAGQPFSDLVAESESKWTAAHRQTGRTKIYVRLTPSVDLFPAGIPNITAVIKGKKVYDPRTATTVWSDNASLCVADFLCNTTAGLEAVYADEIDNAQLIAAANIDDEAVALAGGGTEARYTLNGAFLVNAAPGDTLGKMLTANGGKVRYIGGLFSIQPAAYVAPAITFTEDDCRGVPHIIPRLSAAELCNGVKGLYVSEDNLWQASDFPPVTNATYLAEDGGERAWLDLNLPFTKSAATAQRIAKIELEKRRQQITVEWKGKFNCYRVQPGNTAMLTFAMMGWSAKAFEVAQASLVFEDDGQGGVRLGTDLVLRETVSTVFDWHSGEETSVDVAPNTNLPDPWTVSAPGTPAIVESLYQTTGSAGVKAKATMSWAAVNAAFVADYRPEYFPPGAVDWTVLPPVSDTAIDIVDLVAGLYQFRVRARNVMGVTSTYGPTTMKEIFGLTAPPSNVTAFSVIASNGGAIGSWALSPDLDVRIGGRVVLRWTPLITSAVWENGIDVGEFNGDAVNALLPMLTGTYWAKFKDSTGNWSATAASFVLTAANLTALPNSLTVTEDPAFAGAKSGVAAPAATLELDGTTLIDSLATFVDSWGFIDSMGGAVSAGTYDFATIMDFGSVVSRRITSNIQATAFDTGDMIDSRGPVDDWDSVDGLTVNDATAQLLAAISNDAVTFGAWFPLPVGDVACRAIKFRLALASAQPTHNIGISKLSVTANW